MRFYLMLPALIISANLASAYDTNIIYNGDKPIFKLDFYNKGESVTFFGETQTSPYTLSEVQKMRSFAKRRMPARPEKAKIWSLRS